MDLEKKLVNAFLDNHPEEAAQALNGLRGPVVAELLQAAKPGSAAGGLRHAAPKLAAQAIGVMDADDAARVFKELPLDAQVVFLHRLEAPKRDPLLERLPDRHAATLRRLLDYPKGSAGKLMDPDPLSVRATDSVRDAMKHVRAEAPSVLYYVYVTDSDRRLVGVVTLRQLLQARAGDSVSTIMETNVASLPAMASERDILQHPRWKDFHALPVVDRNGVLIGVIRYETLGRLRETSSRDNHDQDALSTLLALAELYWLGMTGSLDAISVSRVEPAGITGDGETDDR